MSENEYISYWLTSAERDWKAVEGLVVSGSYVQALFFAHLVIEKLLKAHWVKDNGNSFPPRVHNLEYLLSQTNLTMAVEDIDELRIMNAWNIEGRYQDYKDLLYRTTTLEYIEEKMVKVNQLREWLIKELH